MDSTKAQDILRHILKDEDKGLAMMEGLSIGDAIYVIDKILPELMQEADARSSINDIGYFNSLATIYRNIVVDKFKKAEKLWTVYIVSTSYPYMMDNDLVVLYDYANHASVEKQLKSMGYEINFGIENPESFKQEIGHMYRNGYKNVRFIDGKGVMFTVPREDIYPYEAFFGDDYMTNPALQNAMISFFQEYRKNDNLAEITGLLDSRKNLLMTALRNSEYMVPCIKEEEDDTVSIAHPYVDITEQINPDGDEPVYALPAFTDGFELEKCYEGNYENMLYKFTEMLKTVKEIGAAGVVINALGISYYMPVDLMIQILN